ncbi:MAG TPA: cyclic pyranopterin monophosphate synthase MoaC [Candidatus Thermoplasmatota archaeon]|nr:cyclic pyranopterin monophosphate synthase MoaC [Candidatus Thermoplasmatota archaeon]
MAEVGGQDQPPLRRASIARGTLALGPAGRAMAGDAAAGVLAAAQAAGLLAAKQAALRLPAAVPVQLTHVACELAVEEAGVTCTATVQAYAREPLDAHALACCAEALLAAWGMLAGVERDEDGGYATARIVDIGVVQNVVL